MLVIKVMTETKSTFLNCKQQFKPVHHARQSSGSTATCGYVWGSESKATSSEKLNYITLSYCDPWYRLSIYRHKSLCCAKRYQNVGWSVIVRATSSEPNIRVVLLCSIFVWTHLLNSLVCFEHVGWFLRYSLVNVLLLKEASYMRWVVHAVTKAPHIGSVRLCMFVSNENLLSWG